MQIEYIYTAVFTNKQQQQQKWKKKLRKRKETSYFKQLANRLIWIGHQTEAYILRMREQTLPLNCVLSDRRTYRDHVTAYFSRLVQELWQNIAPRSPALQSHSKVRRW